MHLWPNMRRTLLAQTFLLCALFVSAQRPWFGDTHSASGAPPQELLEFGRNMDVIRMDCEDDSDYPTYAYSIEHLNDSVVQVVHRRTLGSRSATNYYRPVDGRYLSCWKNGRLKSQRRLQKGFSQVDSTQHGDTLWVCRTWFKVDGRRLDTTLSDRDLFGYVKGELVFWHNHDAEYFTDNYSKYLYYEGHYIVTDSARYIYSADQIDRPYTVHKTSVVYRKNPKGQVVATTEKPLCTHSSHRNEERHWFFQYTGDLCTRVDLHENEYSSYWLITLK